MQGHDYEPVVAIVLFKFALPVFHLCHLYHIYLCHFYHTCQHLLQLSLQGKVGTLVHKGKVDEVVTYSLPAITSHFLTCISWLAAWPKDCLRFELFVYKSAVKESDLRNKLLK